MTIPKFQKTYLFKAFLFISLFFWASCATSKYKESTKEKDIQNVSLLDTTKTKQLSSGSLTTITENKNFTITKTDTIIKVDSLYFHITTEKTVYSEGSKTVIHDTCFIKEEQKGIKVDSSSQKEKETTIKAKKTINYTFLFYIPILVLIVLILRKKIQLWFT